MSLPTGYKWLASEIAPKMLIEALKLYGTVELPRNADSPIILGWAKEIGLGRVYTHDEVPWCGLYMSVVAKRAGYAPPSEPLWALNWSKFGHAVERSHAMLGDILTFKRNGGGHVTMYVGEDAGAYHCLGGNQSDKVCITRIAKGRLHSVARPIFKVAQPPNIRKIRLAASGTISRNEA